MMGSESGNFAVGVLIAGDFTSSQCAPGEIPPLQFPYRCRVVTSRADLLQSSFLRSAILEP